MEGAAREDNSGSVWLPTNAEMHETQEGQGITVHASIALLLPVRLILGYCYG